MPNTKKKKKLFEVKLLSSAGNSFVNWIGILSENKFRIDFKYIPRALAVTFVTIILTPFQVLEKLLFNRKINKIKLQPPVFIIGHMRSGTTFLHHILSRDKNFSYVTTTEAIFPWVFLTLNKVLRAFMHLVLPEKRPMDNMLLTENLPQEEELAIANLCLYSPNQGAYFPKKIEMYYNKYSFFENVSDKIIKKWKKVYTFFLKKISYNNNEKTVLSKSLVNSCRINLLTEMFPDAKFIFIYRNPYKVFLSTLKLYKKFIFEHMSFQDISTEELQDTVLKLAKKGYRKYLDDKKLIKKGNLIEVKFEDFVKTPIDHLQKIYEDLNLPGFDEAKTNFINFSKKYENYKQDTYNIDEELKNKIYNELKFVFDHYNYER